MSPYDYKYHFLKEHICDPHDGHTHEHDSKLMKCVKCIPCITIKYTDDGGIKLMEMFTINHQGSFYLFFNFFVTFCCLFSSYMYLAIASFRTEGEGSVTLALAIIFEMIFCCDIGVNFLLSFERQDAQSEVVEWNMQKTAYRYFTTDFARDFIPVIPFQNMQMYNRRNKLFYLIKMVRLIKGFRILNEHVIMLKIKAIWKKSVVEKMNKNEAIKTDKINDHNGV